MDVKTARSVEDRLTGKSRSVWWNVMLNRGAVVSVRFVTVLCGALVLFGCSKKRSDAIVIAKEHIDARDPQPSPSSATPSPVAKEPEYREMAADEIDADGFVMKKEVRGTGKDPRATDGEQWRITVRILDNGLSSRIHSDRAHYDKLKIGDRIRVKYFQGKYTGTVWASEIEE